MTNQSKGIAICLLSTLCIVLQDSLSKHMLQQFSIAQIIFVRHIGFIIFAWWWAMTTEKTPLAFFNLFKRAKNPWMQVLRSVLMVIEIAVFFTGLQYIGIAKAHALFMLFPILATLMAIPILKESVGIKEVIALLLGFTGAMFIIRPGSGVFEIHSLIIVGAAFLFALYNVITRFSTITDGFRVSMVYMSTIGLIASAPLGIAQWETPTTPTLWLLIILLTISGILCHLLIVKSLEYTKASVLQPYNYVLIGWAALFGWLFYGELLDIYDYIGILCMLCGGLFMMGVLRFRFFSK